MQLLTLPFLGWFVIDWATVLVCTWAIGRAREQGLPHAAATLSDRRRAAFAIALLTTVTGLLVLNQLGVHVVPNDVAAIVFVLVLQLPSLVNGAFLWITVREGW